MLHLLKYQFLQTIRSRSIMFWALAFPLILGTLFYVSFGNTGLAGTGETDWEPVPVAIVIVDSSSANAASFLTFLNETDQDMIDIHSYKTEKAAKKSAPAGGNIRHLLREVGSFPYHCFQWH